MTPPRALTVLGVGPDVKESVEFVFWTDDGSTGFDLGRGALAVVTTSSSAKVGPLVG